MPSERRSDWLTTVAAAMAGYIVGILRRSPAADAVTNFGCDDARLHSQLTAGELNETVREAYRKQAAELLAIEEAQHKLVLLLLGIFGAAATFLGTASASHVDRMMFRLGVTIVMVAILVVAGIYTWHRNRARTAVRGLLVRCEEALGFYSHGVYLRDRTLYPEGYKQYPERGGWLGASYWFAVIAGLGVVIVLWSAPLPK